MLRMQTVSGAVKRLSDITVTDLHKMKVREMDRIIKILPVVLEQIKGEKNRRQQLPA